jgi:ATP-dependent RNA circularization protein (DNA/RNA ligase family)
MMVEWKWKANSIDRVASPIGAELVSVVVEIVKKVEAEEKLAEKDMEIARLKGESTTQSNIIEDNLGQIERMENTMRRLEKYIMDKLGDSLVDILKE